MRDTVQRTQITALCQSKEEDSEELFYVIALPEVVGQHSCCRIELHPEDSIGSLGTGVTDV